MKKVLDDVVDDKILANNYLINQCPYIARKKGMVKISTGESESESDSDGDLIKYNSLYLN